MGDEEITQAIVVEGQPTLEQLQREIAAGAKFVVFRYCYSLLAVTLTRFSPAILVRDRAHIARARRKYNRISGLLGWWGIPWGPVRTIQTWLANRSGLDVTNDIMLNITAESLTSREVELELCHDVFSKPRKSELKDLRKTIVGDLKNDERIKKIVVAFFVNTRDTPHLTIGIQFDGNFDELVSSMRATLRKHYHENVRFDFIDLTKPGDLATPLLEQGETLLGGLPTARAVSL